MRISTYLNLLKRGNELQNKVGKKIQGTYVFRLVDGEDVVERRESNMVVESGELALLDLLSGVRKPETSTFRANKKQDVFSLNPPNYPVEKLYWVKVDGSKKTMGKDFTLNYRTGKLMMDAAPGKGASVKVKIAPRSAPFRYMAVGKDNTPVTKTQTSLKNEVSRVGVDSVVVDEDNVECRLAFEFGENVPELRVAEAGLFNRSTEITGDMFNRTVVEPALPKQKGQVLKAEWTLKMPV